MEMRKLSVCGFCVYADSVCMWILLPKPLQVVDTTPDNGDTHSVQTPSNYWTPTERPSSTSKVALRPQTETVRTNKDGELRTATLTFTQLLTLKD